MNDYHINVFYSEEDQCYIADVPDLRFCSAFGSSPEAALAQVQLAKKEWLRTAHETGLPIPEPTYRPSAQAQ